MVDLTSAIKFNGISGNTVTVINWVLAGIILLGVIIFIFYIKKFNKIRVKLYEETDTGPMLSIETKARLYKNRDGVQKWQLWWKRRVVSPPPSKALVVDAKGKKVAYGMLKDDTIIWFVHNLDVSGVQSGEIEFKPLKPEHKSAMAYEFREADSYKRKRIGELLMNLAPIMAVIIIVVVFLIFVPAVVEKTTEMVIQVTGSVDTMLEKQNQLLDKYDAILNNRLILESNTNTTKVPN